METPICSAHKTPMVWKEAGVSQAGKPYEGFWGCKEKVNGKFCRAKPEMPTSVSAVSTNPQYWPGNNGLPEQPKSEVDALWAINASLQEIAIAIKEGREREPEDINTL